jgi:hypothetical protein
MLLDLRSHLQVEEEFVPMPAEALTCPIHGSGRKGPRRHRAVLALESLGQASLDAWCPNHRCLIPRHLLTSSVTPLSLPRARACGGRGRRRRFRRPRATVAMWESVDYRSARTNRTADGGRFLPHPSRRSRSNAKTWPEVTHSIRRLRMPFIPRTFHFGTSLRHSQPFGPSRTGNKTSTGK